MDHGTLSKMGRWLGLCLFLILLGVPLASSLALAPDFTVTDIDGHQFTLSEYQGTVVLLEYFSTTCGRCLDEIPHLQEVYYEISSSLTILSICDAYWHTNEGLREFRDEYPIPWRIALDTADVRGMYNVTSFPTLYIIDQNGYIRYQHLGELVDTTTLIAEIQELLTFPLTITTAPILKDVHFQVDGHEYATTASGSVSLELGVGMHTLELVNSSILTEDGFDYQFSHWSGVTTTSLNPLLLNVTDPVFLTAHFDRIDILPPIINAGPNQTVPEDTVAIFDGSSSTDNVGITRYTWTFLDRTPQTVTGMHATYTFTTPGTYHITLNGTDAADNWATDTVTITITDVTSPTVQFEDNRTVPEDTSILFDGSMATDNVAITRYTWTFQDETSQTLTGITPTYTFLTPGVYAITLNVTDAAGNWATDTIAIIVQDTTAPVAHAGSDRTVPVGVSVNVTGLASTDNVGILHYTWTYGDGAQSTGISSSHIYSAIGTYTITLTVHDQAGNNDTDQFIVQVIPSADNGLVLSPSTIFCTPPSSDVFVGTSMTIAGSLDPAMGGVTVTVTYTRPDGSTFNRTVITKASGSFEETFQPTLIGRWRVVASWKGNTTHQGATTPIYTFTVNEASRCLIATATFGSELSPQVHFLRSFRDDRVLSTFAGYQFIEVFNSIYYSFSPNVADAIRRDHGLRDLTKAAVCPLIGVLQFSESVFSLLSFSPELAIIVAGCVACLLLTIIYCVPWALLLSYFTNCTPSHNVVTALGLFWLAALTAIGLAEITHAPWLMMTATGTFVLTTVATTLVASLKCVPTIISRLKHLSKYIFVSPNNN